jgi:hypothetical protein
MRTVAVLIVLMASARAFATPPGQDPDWPCQQRLVPELTVGAYWSGLAAPDANWRDDAPVAQLVAEIAPRDVPPEDGVAKIETFAKTLNPAERSAALSLVFAGVTDETNRLRDSVIERIKELTRRQRGIAQQVGKATDQVSAIPADATGPDAEKRAEAVERQTMLTRTFEDTRRTMRYACNAPTALEARLGLYARTLQELL